MNERLVVVGGTSGIGLEVARRCAERYAVAIVGRDPERLKSALESLPGNVIGRSVDAGDRAAMSRFLAELGSVDHLVLTSTAGAGAVGPVAELPVETVRETVDGKLLGWVATVQAALPVLRSGGSITGLSAASAHGAAPGTSALAAANAAVEAWMRVLAAEVAPTRVNVVSPGIIDTPWWSFLPEEERRAAFQSYASGMPVGRIGAPADVAAAVEYLIGSTFTTGAVLHCDGGASLAA